MIKLINIEKSFGSQKIFCGLNLDVAQGETVVLFGPSGVGKTVLLKMCLGLIKPDKGEIHIDGERTEIMTESELTTMRLKTGMLFQYYALFDSMTVSENVGFYLANHTNLSPDEINKRVKEDLERVRLTGSELLKPSELSGGMQKRVGIARALVHRPKLIFYDAPTDGLDPVTSDVIIELIADLNRQLGITALVISNDMNTAFKLANHMGMIYKGKMHAFGTPDEIAGMRDPYVFQFIRGNEQGPLLEETNASLSRSKS
jgi:phospholipid/cholesterol/gamma-HCH transport system ATP-binding protein